MTANRAVYKRANPNDIGGPIFSGRAYPVVEVTGGTITPVPEPSSLVPLAGGLGWLVFGLARRRFARMR
jgi:hypothetical protein